MSQYPASSSPWLSVNGASRYARCRAGDIKNAAAAGLLDASVMRDGQHGRRPALLVKDAALDQWILAGRPTTTEVSMPSD